MAALTFAVVLQSTQRIKSGVSLFFPTKTDSPVRAQMSRVVYKARCWDS